MESSVQGSPDQSHCTASKRNSPNSSSVSSSVKIAGSDSSFTGNKEESIGSNFTADDEHVSGGRMVASELGRKGSLGVSAIFTAGIADLSGHIK
jgi:hypothetical protein